MSDERIRDALSAEAGAAPRADDVWVRTERRLRRRRIRQGLGGLGAVGVVAVLGTGALAAPWQQPREVALDREESADGGGYGALLDAVPLAAGERSGARLTLHDVPLAADAAGVDLPAPGAQDWSRFERLALDRRWAGMQPFRAGISRLEERAFAAAVGFVPTDVHQAATWNPDGQAGALTLRRDTGELATFLEHSDDWVRRGDDPRWYRGAEDAAPAVAEALAPYEPAELAVVVEDGMVQVGAAPGTQAPDGAVPAALAPDGRQVGDLAGMDRLAGQLDGWASSAVIAPRPHLDHYFGEARGVAPAGQPLEPYQHFALAQVADGAGQRTALVLVHGDAEAARVNAERLRGNLAEVGREEPEVRRDGTVVVVDRFADHFRGVMASHFRPLRVAVPEGLRPDGAAQAGVGDAVTLPSVQGTRLEVRLVEVYDPATHDPSASPKQNLPPDAGVSADDNRPPGPDERLVAVRLRLANVGEARYEAPLFDRVEVTADGERLWGSTPVTHVTECDELGEVTLAPGDTASGCLVFAVDEDRQPQWLELALDDTESAETATWRLGG